MATELYGRAPPVALWVPEAGFGIWPNGTVAATEEGRSPYVSLTAFH
jgi:hypothetical protein